MTPSQFAYRSPVDREFIAQLLRTLEARKPSVIGLDVLFDQPTEPQKDQLLKATIAGLTVPLVVSFTDDPEIVDDQQRKYLDAFVPRSIRGRAELKIGPVDGVVRWIFPGAPEKDGSYLPGLARAIAQRVGVATPAIPEEIAWHGQPKRGTPAFKLFPAHLVPLLPSSWFTGKIVLIGEVVSLTDRHRTPFTLAYIGAQGELSGIEIQAHAVSQLVEGRHSRHIGLAGEFALVGALALVGVVLGLINRGLARHVALAAAALWAFGFALVLYNGVAMPLVEPSIALTLATWGADALIGRQARRQRGFIESAFSLYLSPALVKQLPDDPALLKLGARCGR